MKRAVSKDGTSIAYKRSGDGPPLVLVGGPTATHQSEGPLAAELVSGHTVHVHDRRGRGKSGDTAPYAVDREIEDLAAVIEAAGGEADVYGVSSGGALALEAAASGLPINRVAVYEVPYSTDPSTKAAAEKYSAELAARLAADDNGGAVEAFLRHVGLPEDSVAEIRRAPFWRALKGIAPTLAYDDAVLGGGEVPVARLAQIQQPVLVVCGGAGPQWFRDTGQAVAQAIPNGRYETLEGQDHQVAPDVLAPVLREFFAR